jgi:hypothetical protein
MEELRKSYVGELMTREQALDLLEAMGLPKESPKVWELCLKYQVLIKKGTTRYTRYCVPIDMYSKHTLDKMEDEFYNGKRPVKKAPEKLDKELGRTKLSPRFCMDYLDKCDDTSMVDFCIEQLKKRGNYMIFEVTPNIQKLNAISLEYLVHCSDCKRK